MGAPVPPIAKAEIDEIAGENACAAAAARGEQVELFASPTSGLGAEEAEAYREGIRRVGRPKGASSKQVRELRDWLLKGGVLPQQELMRWAIAGPKALMREFGMTGKEAFSEWRALNEGLGRYFLPPMAPTDGEGNPLPQIAVLIGGSSGVQAANGQTLAPWQYLELQAQQDQALSEGDAVESQNGESQK